MRSSSLRACVVALGHGSDGGGEDNYLSLVVDALIKLRDRHSLQHEEV